MRSSANIAQTLLAVDTEQLSALSPRIKLYAFILAILNLIPSGLSENVLRIDREGYHLSLFLFSHSVVFVLVGLSYFVGSSRDILEKVRLLPTTALSRILFVITANLRHPFSIALMSSNAFFLIVLYWHHITVGITAVVLYLLLVTNISTIAAAVFLHLEKKGASVGIALVVVALAAFAALVGSFAYEADAILQKVPLVNFCVNGILSALSGDWFTVLLNLVLLTAVAAGVIWLGKRFL
ncbi:MAG: hypothetical protein KF749_15230 [Bacteroidetes bacterium]|nr:hypothetical protein [Bacteroidota bacterium]MCW5897290.1 hypothetical protein [Bacteroidota bacterium]